MAFLCPSRLGRNKQKRGYESLIERLKESTSINSVTLKDLVKLSWTTAEARRIILQNFTAYAPQEVTVKQGQKVNYIYREGDWAYVVTEHKKEGFVPFAFLAKIGVPSKPAPRKTDTGTYTKRVSDLNQRKISVESEGTDHSGSDLADDSFASTGWSNDSFTECRSGGTVKERPSVNYLQTEPLNKLPMFYEVFLDERTNILHKNPLPAPDTFTEKGTIHPADDIGLPSPSLMFKVMHNFAGQDVYDVKVKTGEIVHLLDDSDPGWFWVCKHDGAEGYVPSNYICEIREDSIDDIDIARKENRKIEPSHQKYITADHSCNDQTVNKSCNNDFPTKWKVTNDLKGKILVNTSTECTDVSSDNKRQRPKKPPRKKKIQQNGMSPTLNDSMDSLDTCITDSSADYLGFENKSSCDELSPRSFIFSESSILDSSFNEVYNHEQYGNNFFVDLSPRSCNSQNVQAHRNNTALDEALEPNFAHKTCRQLNNNESNKSNNIREVNCDKTLKCHFESSGDIRVSKHGIEKVREEPVNVQQREKLMSESNSRQMSDSSESKSSNCQRHKRPLSVPAFKPYQEYQKDYFDEYFYEDNDIKFTNRSKTVVNVSEILKLRNNNEQQKHSRRNENCVANIHRSEVRKMPSANRSKREPEMNEGDQKIKEKQRNHEQPTLKQFLLDLPSTKLDHKAGNTSNQNGKTVYAEDKDNETIQSQVRKRFSSSTDVQNTGIISNVKNELNRNEFKKSDAHDIMIFQKEEMKTMVRQFNSSTDLRLSEVKNQKEKVQHYEFNQMSPNMSSRRLENKENSKKHKKTHLRPYNSSTDLREIRGKPDWSFGYPKKTRKSIGRTENENQLNRKFSERDRGIEDNGNRKSREKHKNETKGDIQIIHNFEVKQDTVPIIKIYLNKTRKTQNDNVKKSQTYRSSEVKADRTCDDEDMMIALLRQTDNLLQKTDKLLNDDEAELLGEEVVMETNDGENEELDISDGKKIAYESHQKPSANEKCSKFLKNITIGIHGMIYAVTQDSVTNEDNIPKRDTSKANGQTWESPCITVSKSGENETKDMRKEKSNVMKLNSSKIVSEELKYLDLKDIRGITEFVCQCDYEPDTETMLPIKHGEIVHVGLDGQDSGEWYWAFSPRLRKNGFVPKKYVKIPLVTII